MPTEDGVIGRATEMARELCAVERMTARVMSRAAEIATEASGTHVLWKE
jgi:hypothetical protein